MLRTMTLRTLLLLGGIGAAVAAAEPAVAQTPCIPGYYYNPIYGCLVDGEAYVPRPYIPPHRIYAHPYHPSSGFSPGSHTAGGAYIPEHSLPSQHFYVPPSSSGFSMSHSGSFGHGSLGGGGFGHGR